MTRRRGALVVTAVAAVLLAGCTAEETGPIDDPSVVRIGLLSTLSGPFAPLGEAANRGAKLALLEAGGALVGTGPLDTVRGAKAGGKQVQLFIEGSDDVSPDIAVSAARRLVEQRGVDVIVGPTSGEEGLAVKNYVSSVPTVTLVNGTAATQNMTLRDPVPNVFRFSTDGAQWMAGLGTYAAERYERVATVAEDHTYFYDQVGGFLTEFCTPGHSVAERVWIPPGTGDYAAYISRIPKNVDAVFVALGGSEAVNFVRQLDEFTGDPDLPLVAGSLTVDPAIIADLGERVEGTVSAGPVAVLPDNPEYRQYTEALARHYPGAPPPGFADVLYYVAMKATLTALEQARGDAGGEQRAFRAALAGVAMDTPQGPVRLDANRQVVANNYLFQVTDGQSTLLDEVPAVTQTLGRDPAAYTAQAAFDRSNPVCPAGDDTPTDVRIDG
ncbi:MAG: ABC transporter substrate-binding protein [Pseudonocardia sp.]